MSQHTSSTSHCIGNPDLGFPKNTNMSRYDKLTQWYCMLTESNNQIKRFYISAAKKELIAKDV